VASEAGAEVFGTLPRLTGPEGPNSRRAIQWPEGPCLFRMGGFVLRTNVVPGHKRGMGHPSTHNGGIPPFAKGAKDGAPAYE